jgi:hypothetical protein
LALEAAEGQEQWGVLEILLLIQAEQVLLVALVVQVLPTQVGVGAQTVERAVRASAVMEVLQQVKQEPQAPLIQAVGEVEGLSAQVTEALEAQVLLSLN